MNCWIVVPAAGVGARAGGSVPKQYQLLSGRTLVEHTLARLLQLEPDAIVVAIHRDDRHWQQLPMARDSRIRTVTGGEQRADSVRLALAALAAEADAEDWVLVHDAARPCVTTAQIRLLMTALQDHAIGGLLAVPVQDTVKRVRDAHAVVATEDRANLWLAQTPQAFRFGILRQALELASARQGGDTDEAAAVERLGHLPRVVRGRRDNIKVTEPQDFILAEAILDAQHRESEGV